VRKILDTTAEAGPPVEIGETGRPAETVDIHGFRQTNLTVTACLLDYNATLISVRAGVEVGQIRDVVLKYLDEFVT
jgi:hypothetical protein